MKAYKAYQPYADAKMADIEKLTETACEYCKWPGKCTDQEALDEKCDSCEFVELAQRLVELRGKKKGCKCCDILNKPIDIEKSLIEHKKIVPFITITLVESGLKISSLNAKYCPMCGKEVKHEI